jgi:hypothetical protein
VPKIDWRDDEELPRWERLYHPRRQHFARLAASPRMSVPPILSLSRDTREPAPTRQPLHLIWGEPSRSAPSP